MSLLIYFGATVMTPSFWTFTESVVLKMIRPTLKSLTRGVRCLDAQAGFSLIEISIVTTLMMLIAIIGIPAIQGYVIGGAALCRAHESKYQRVWGKPLCGA
jgi:hypothetical protein